MAYLSMTLLGAFRAWTEDGELQPLRTLKERLLLSYLAVEHLRPHRRETLAELFWPNAAESVSRNSLRQALFGLRQAFGAKQFDRFCTVSTQEVQFHLNQHVWTDLAAYDMHFKAVQQHYHAQDQICSYCFQHLYDAAELYRGEFLEDISIDGNLRLQSWLLQHRQRYCEQQMMILDGLSQTFEKMGDLAQAVRCIERQAALDGTDQSLYRRWMVLAAKLGQPQTALEIYEKLGRRQNDLEPQTIQLADQIRNGQLERQVVRETVHNLPEQPMRFIGREIELLQLQRAFEDPLQRLFCVVGPGGVGKTRFALHAAQMMLPAFPDGVYFIPVENVPDASHLPDTIARSLGLTQNQPADITVTIQASLGRRRVLLLLDNFEHLIGAGDFLLELLRAAPNLKILVTSRERLHMQSETVMEMDGLPYQSLPNASEAPPAARLFLDRAARARSLNSAPVIEDIQDPQVREAIEKICALVNGLPLAIELAASWANEFTFAQIAQEIERNADFLRTNMRDIPGRHRSLWASFEHSWNLLSDMEQEVFCRLAVFPGSFDARAAQDVAGAAFPWLISLLEKSMLRRVTFGRYELHPYLRQFAGQKLLQFSRKTEEATRRQHAQYFLAWMADQSQDLISNTQVLALQQIDLEIDNVLASWKDALAAGTHDSFPGAARGLFYYLETRSRWKEGVDCFALAVDRLRDHPDPRARQMLIYSLACLGWFSCRLSQFETAQRYLQESLDLLDPDQNSPEKTFTHFAFGFLMVWMAQYVSAWQHLSISLESAKEQQDAWAIAWARELLTEIAVESEQQPFQQAPFLQNLQAFEQLGDQRGIARVLNYLGNIAMTDELYPQAEAYFRRMLTTMESLGDLWGAASGYGKLGRLAISRAEFREAIDLLQHSLELYRRTGDLRREAFVLGDLGEASAALDDHAAAERCFAMALDTAQSSQRSALAQDILTSAASAAMHQQKNDAAVTLLGCVMLLPITDRLTARRVTLLLKQLNEQGSAPAAGSGDETAFWRGVQRFRAALATN